MPKRTNEFQELVALIERAFAPKNAKITESVEIKIDGLNTLREVDIIIEGPFGEYSLKVAIEVRDSKSRKLSIQAFDTYVAKYRGECRVLVDKFLLVSRKGFTKGVYEKAQKLDVELLTIDEAKNKDWSKVVPAKIHFDLEPHVCRLSFEPLINVDDPKKIWYEGKMICPHGHDHGTPFNRAKCLVFHKIFPSNPQLVSEFKKKVRETSNGQALASIKVPFRDYKIELHDQTFDISSMTIHVHAISAEGKAKHCVYERQSSTEGKKIIHHFETIAGGKKLTLLVPDGPSPPKQVVLRIENAKSSKKKQGKPK